MTVFYNVNMRCHKSVILPKRKMRQEHSKIEAILDYIGRHFQRKKERKIVRKEGRREGGEKSRDELRSEKMSRSSLMQYTVQMHPIILNRQQFHFHTKLMTLVHIFWVTQKLSNIVHKIKYLLNPYAPFLLYHSP